MGIKRLDRGFYVAVRLAEQLKNQAANVIVDLHAELP